MTLHGLAPAVTTSRLRVVHRSTFRYERRVTASFNECRLTPRSDDRQQVQSSQVDVNPVTWQFGYTDYWGTQVLALEILTPHTELTVTSTTIADVTDAPPVPQVLWDELLAPSTADRHAEMLLPTPRSDPGPDLSRLAHEAARGRTPPEAAHAICSLVTESVEYKTGSTGVKTVALEAWESKRGVCQDIAHLAIGALRSAGIPARYVSGYLHPRPESIGAPATGESHAWVEWWTGGWYGWDPTNDGPAAGAHLVVGRGRDYGDVPPIKGIVAGAATSVLEVAVEVTRLS